MIPRWIKLLVIIAVSIVFLWGAILGFGSSFDCVWPSLDELMATSRLPASSLDIELEDRAAARLEAAVAHAIGRKGAFYIRFTPERDFIEHALPGSPRVWQYGGGELVAVEKRVALRAMQAPVEMGAYLSGDFPRLFRFSVLDRNVSHACVIVEIDEAAGGMNYFAFWHLFRSGFGLGPWWVLPGGGVFFGY